MRHIDPAKLALYSLPVESRQFDYPVIAIVRGDYVIEIYAVVNGLEVFAGRLDASSKIDPGKITVLLRAIKSRIRQIPMSSESHHWLHALSESGLLSLYEEVVS
jgi:hypothetical protein